MVYFMLRVLHKGKLRMLRQGVGRPRGTEGLKSRQSCFQASSPLLLAPGGRQLALREQCLPHHSYYLFCYFLSPALRLVLHNSEIWEWEGELKIKLTATLGPGTCFLALGSRQWLEAGGW